jgi:glycosyltransferase involved in cell wall biosynthesis
MMKIAVVTDAWRPQVNGVVRTLEKLAELLVTKGIRLDFLSPDRFFTLPVPTYPDIRLSLTTKREVGRQLQAMSPDYIHIATEGPLGVLARRYCLGRKLPFTTSYHTRFPEYLAARLPVPPAWSYGFLRRFHNAGSGVLVATASLRAELAERGFVNMSPWTRGVDTELFHPEHRRDLRLKRPIFLNVGRVAVEKNLPAFLDLDLPGSKVVVGDGPELARLRQRYPQVHFLGLLSDLELAQVYADADVFVFPSRTDTFGNVILEALASGCPVAAYPVTGPLDIFADGRGGVVRQDLRDAAMAALDIDRQAARAKAMAYGWDECARQFVEHVSRCRPTDGARAERTEAVTLPRPGVT